MLIVRIQWGVIHLVKAYEEDRDIVISSINTMVQWTDHWNKYSENTGVAVKDVVYNM